MRLKNKVIATLVAEGVEDLEYHVPVMRLQEEGAKVLSAGLDLKPVRGKNGLVITPDAKIEDLKASELFAIILPKITGPGRRHPLKCGFDLDPSDPRRAQEGEEQHHQPEP